MELDDQRPSPGRVVGTFLADLVFFSCVLGLTIISGKFLAKMAKIALRREMIRNMAKNQKTQNQEDYYPDDLSFE
jgi:hypothetical protein